MGNYYDGLFKLCGFEDEEIKEERRRIEASFERLGIGPEDMDTADSWAGKTMMYHWKGLENYWEPGSKN